MAAPGTSESPGQSGSHSLGFDVLGRDAQTRARRGRLRTAHGTVETPAFMPVGTYGAVKAMAPWEIEDLGSEMILSNAYHLELRPGSRQIARLGGLHRFMGWNGSILTDSGGFQIFSLKSLRKVDESGVEFKSHVDGSRHQFRPEDVIEVQENLGVDVAMVLDECVAGDASEAEVAEALARTTRWAKRARAARSRTDQHVFAIVQGGLNLRLREQSAAELADLGFDGYAVGGLSVGEDRQATYEVANHTVGLLPEERPRYLMGVGTPEELVQYTAMGFDLFDCVLPTRNARNGMAFTSEGRLTIKNATHREDTAPLDPSCSCPCCGRFTRAYLRHLFVTNEMLAARALTTHNLHFYLNRMSRLRTALDEGRFAQEAASFLIATGGLETRAPEAGGS